MISAGARFTVIRRGGSAKPSAERAARTRSRDSATALSGRPTIVKAGSPAAIVTWVSISPTSTPRNATVRTRATMFRPVPYARRQGRRGERGRTATAPAPWCDRLCPTDAGLASVARRRLLFLVEIELDLAAMRVIEEQLP